jgi:hypothetical protein
MTRKFIRGSLDFHSNRAACCINRTTVAIFAVKARKAWITRGQRTENPHFPPNRPAQLSKAAGAPAGGAP